MPCSHCDGWPWFAQVVNVKPIRLAWVAIVFSSTSVIGIELTIGMLITFLPFIALRASKAGPGATNAGLRWYCATICCATAMLARLCASAAGRADAPAAAASETPAASSAVAPPVQIFMRDPPISRTSLGRPPHNPGDLAKSAPPRPVLLGRSRVLARRDRLPAPVGREKPLRGLAAQLLRLRIEIGGDLRGRHPVGDEALHQRHRAGRTVEHGHPDRLLDHLV